MPPGKFIAVIGLLATAMLAGEPRVGPIPESFRSELELASFYEKHIDAGGLPIVSSGRVSDFALLEARYLVLQMIGHRPELLRALAHNGVRFVVMAPNEFTTMIPEHSDLQPADYWDRRTRGLGGSRRRPIATCGEENLLGYAGDPYSTENALLHEFGHAIHNLGMDVLDPTFDARVKGAFEAAKRDGLWSGTYAATNRHEYWAEGVQSWFDSNRENDEVHNAVNTRAELKTYDPRLAALLEEVFADGAWRYEPPAKRSPPSPHLAGFDARQAPSFVWPPHLATALQRYGDDDTPSITAAAPELPALASTSRADWRSPSGSAAPTLVEFENIGPATVMLEWIDFEGQPKKYFTLQRGEKAHSRTFAGHVWRARDERGTPLGYFVATENPARAVVEATVHREAGR